ncbi:MAG: hypothetical protein K8S23_03565 [Candidatus Cloacimonetes bacterium]|nr:hypothetical protein [Candidatus Cloacimonadota bacterium]
MYNEQQNEHISTFDWIITFFIMAIPLVNFIMLIIWAFGDSSHPSKANWAKASLIWMILPIVIFFLFITTFVGLLPSIIDIVNF